MLGWNSWSVDRAFGVPNTAGLQKSVPQQQLNLMLFQSKSNSSLAKAGFERSDLWKALMSQSLEQPANDDPRSVIRNRQSSHFEDDCMGKIEDSTVDPRDDACRRVPQNYPQRVVAMVLAGICSTYEARWKVS